MMDTDRNGTTTWLAIAIVLGLVLTSGVASAVSTPSSGSGGGSSGPCVETYGPPSPSVGVRPSDCIGHVEELLPT